MSLTVSPVIKIFALVGVLAALALGAGMMLLGGQSEAETAPAVLPTKKSGLLAAPARAKKVAAEAKASAAAKQAVATPADAKPAAKATPAAKPKAKAKPAEATSSRSVASNGLPLQIMVALRSHNVVVVSLWGTDGKIDEMSRDEARAGAAAVGAGFVSLNVIEQGREAQALTLKLGVMLRAPAVLFFTAGGVLANTLDGFRDRELVAQAALNALR
jgi:hypothetical protein